MNGHLNQTESFLASIGEENQPHLKDYLRIISTKRWIMFGTFVFVMFLAWLWLARQTPIYRSEATLLIEPVKINLTNFKGVYDPVLAMGGIGSYREFVETQCKLILARPILEKTFHHFELGKRPQFRAIKDPAVSLGGYFRVYPIRNSRLVSVVFFWRNPKEAAQILEYHVNTYISEYKRRSIGVTEGGLEALKEKADEIRPMLEAKADAIQDFMVENNMVSLEKTQNIVVDRLKSMNQNLSEVERNKLELETVHENIKQALEKKLPLEDMPEVAGSSIIGKLKLEYLEKKQEYNDLSGRFGPNHPEVRAASARLEVIAKRMKREAKSVLAVTRARLARAKRQVWEVRKELKEQELKVMDFNKLAVRYNTLKSDYDAMSRTYNAIVMRVQEIEISMATGSKDDNIFMVSKPTFPHSPAKPNKRKTMILAFLLAILLSVCLAFFADYLDTTIKSKEDVEHVLGVPVIGYIPPCSASAGFNGNGAVDRRELITLAEPRSALAEAFRSIRTAISFSCADEELKHFMVSSPSPADGKTIVSANMAIAFANSGKKVLLVDADLRKPKQHKLFNVDSEPGLSNMIVREGVESLHDAIRPIEGLENLYLMPCGSIPYSPEILGSNRMGELLKEMNEEFDLVIFDTPPVVNVSDATLLCQHVPWTILVVRSFSTQRELAKRARDLLAQSKSRVWGAVLNNVDIPSSSYNYYYRSYYYYDPEYGDNGAGEPKKKKKKKRRRRQSDEAVKEA